MSSKSPAKCQLADSMTGYVLQVSPKKRRETEFHFTFQSREDTAQRAKCYDTKKRSALVEHQLSGNPVKIRSVGVYNMPKNSGFCGISINNQSTLETPSSAEVFFKKMNRLFIDIDEILDKNEVDDIIDVHGVVDMRESKIEMKQVFGADKRMMEDINLSDSTGHIKLTLWEDHIDYVQEQTEQGCSSFAFHGICIKKFGKKYI